MTGKVGHYTGCRVDRTSKVVAFRQDGQWPAKGHRTGWAACVTISPGRPCKRRKKTQVGWTWVRIHQRRRVEETPGDRRGRSWRAVRRAIWVRYRLSLSHSGALSCAVVRWIELYISAQPLQENLQCEMRYRNMKLRIDHIECLTFLIKQGVECESTRSRRHRICLLYTSPSPRDQRGSRMPSSA